MKIVPVEEHDLPQIKDFLVRVGLSLAGVERHFPHFLKLVLDGDLVAIAGLELYNTEGLLRSVAVIPEYRKSGLGDGLTKAIINRARSLGISDLYVVTDRAAGYFYRFGFQLVDLKEISPLLGLSEQLRSRCWENEICLHMKL